MLALLIPLKISDAAHLVGPLFISERTQRVRAVYGELNGRMNGSNPTEAYAVAEALVDESDRHGFDPLFVLAVIDTESKFEVEAVSKSGARGLMQILPSTFKEFSSSARMFDPAENVRTGIKVLGYLSHQFKKPETLLLAYNAGPGGAQKILKGEKIHSVETRSYAKKVMNSYDSFLKKHGRDPKKSRQSYYTVKK